MGVVKQMSDYRPPLEAVEPKVAQLEEGFTRLANELLEATMSSGLPETELCIVMAVWRKTYGFSKKMDWISNEQLGEMILKHYTHCSTAKNNLIRKKVLVQEGRKIGINTTISEWQTKNNGKCLTLAEPAKKTLAEPANAPLQNLLTTKETTQKKEIKQNTQSSCDDHSPVKPARRKTLRINYEEYLDAYNEIVGDRLPHAVEANAERKRKLKTLIGSLATKNLDGFKAYVNAFMRMARPFHFGDNDRGWSADFDYLLRPKVLTKIREGTL
ncbi:TPA: replication protein [Enterobacter asburiae]|nr:replication protein [Enterobacter asburiae]HCR2018676.1 replication protein [Enterobacter asburiae]HCR2025505.1 replication protein [Enterobacter asburiae]HCR2035173.1 replication protein [Enterobacter asburiae]HCR2039337.1 replication protein [Enterobacter asburiae]